MNTRAYLSREHVGWVGVLVVGMVLGFGAEVRGQYGYDDAYSPGGYNEGGGYSDPAPAPAPGGGGGGGGSRGLFGGPNFRYGYLEAEYKWMTFSSDFFEDRSAYGGEISLGGGGNLYLKFAGLYSPASDEDLIEASYFYGSVGPGLALPIGSAVDITFDGGLAYQKFDTDLFGSGDGLGFYMTPGLRVGLGSHFELTGALRYLNVEDESGFMFNLGAHIYLTDNIVIVGSADFAEEMNLYGVGLRVNF